MARLICWPGSSAAQLVPCLGGNNVQLTESVIEFDPRNFREDDRLRLSTDRSGSNFIGFPRTVDFPAPLIKRVSCVDDV
jgi:hypothetical protein